MMGAIRRLLGWDELDQLAEVLCENFTRQVTPTCLQKKELVERAFSNVVGRAVGEKRKGKWKYGAVARLSNSFGWALVKRGYPQDWALSLSRSMAVVLAQK
jgi:hypothetical protein